MRATFVGAFLILVAASVPGQFPIGQATPVNGFGPALFSGPLWIGNQGYGYRIHGAPPGGSAFVGIALARQDQTIGGLGVYLDLATVLITHSATVDANGEAAFPVPLDSPDNSALTGLQFYAQGAVVDPAGGAVGTTEALLLEITAHPMAAFTRWAGALFLLDPVAGTMQSVPGLPPSATVLDLLFANAGRDLFVATNQGLFVVDSFAVAPQAVSLLAGWTPSIAWDRVHRRVYGVNSLGIVCLEGDRASPAFGTILTQISDTAGLTSLSISTAGDLLALAYMNGTVTRRDADPASPTFLQLIPTPAPSWSAPLTGFGRVHISPDGRIVTMPTLQGLGPSGPVIHRFDAIAGTWVDYDPVTPGYQPLSPDTHPALLGTSTFFAARDGSAFVTTSNLGSPGAYAVARVELDLDSPADVTLTTTSPPAVLNLSYYVGLTPSGSFLLRWQDPFFSIQPVLELVHIATGVATPFFDITPPSPYLVAPVAAWR
jgi:hypothetical protein